MTEKKSELEEILRGREDKIGEVLRILQNPHPGVHYRTLIGSMDNVNDAEVVLPKEDYFLFRGSYNSRGDLSQFFDDSQQWHEIEGLGMYNSDRVFILLRKEKED